MPKANLRVLLTGEIDDARLAELQVNSLIASLKYIAQYSDWKIGWNMPPLRIYEILPRRLRRYVNDDPLGHAVNKTLKF
jgi:hypothetical protein